MSHKIQLESFYLAKVILQLPYMNEVKNFMMVSKKCELSVKMLKMTPSFHNTQSLQWFLNHFDVYTINPHGMHIDEIKLLSSGKLLRNPSLSFPFIHGNATKEQLIELFPHVTRLSDIRFSPSDNDNEEEQERRKEYFEFLIENAQKFDRLEYLEGDLGLITCFMEVYTNNGEELNIRMPRLIIVREFNGFLINPDEDIEVFELIERLEKCLPEGNRVECHVIFSYHLNEEQIRKFKRIHYHYFSIKKKGGKYKKDNLYIENGTLFVDDVMVDNSMNEIIEKVCPLHLKYRYIKNRENENWTIPSCVRKMLIHSCWNEQNFDVFEIVNVEMPTIEELTLSKSYNLVFNKKEFPSLRILKLENVSGMNFQGMKFPALELLFINKSDNIKFMEDCEFNQNKENGISIKIIKTKTVIFDGQMDNVKELVVVDSVDVLVPCHEPKLINTYQVLSTLFFSKTEFDTFDYNQHPS